MSGELFILLPEIQLDKLSIFNVSLFFLSFFCFFFPVNYSRVSYDLLIHQLQDAPSINIELPVVPSFAVAWYKYCHVHINCITSVNYRHSLSDEIVSLISVIPTFDKLACFNDNPYLLFCNCFSEQFNFTPQEAFFCLLLSLLLRWHLKPKHVIKALMLSWIVCTLSQQQEKNGTLQIVVQPLFKQGALAEPHLLHPWRHDLFVSYRTQEAKGAVSSFRVMDCQNTIGLESSAVHGVFQPCGRNRAGLRVEAPSQADSTEQMASGSSHCNCHCWVVHQKKSTHSLLKYFSPLFRQSCVDRFSLSLGRCFVLFIHNSPKRSTYSYSEIKQSCLTTIFFPEIQWFLPQSWISSKDKLLELSIH